MSRIKLFSHCDMDGIGCAVLEYLAFGRENVDVEYCDYKDVNEKVEDFYLNDRDKIYDAAFITDISVNEEVADQIDLIVKVDGKWRLFDHHATALGLNKYEWCTVRTEDPDGVLTSGTKMFWSYLDINSYFDKFDDRTREKICEFVKFVQYYDTWMWKELGRTECKELNDLFHMYGRKKFIDLALERVYNDLKVFLWYSETDMALLEQKQKDIDIYIAQKNKQLVTMEDNFGYKCGVVFAERYFSELGNKLSELHPELDYIAMIDMGFGGVSYRTTRDDIDLGGTIAHSLGGGGHAKAAGSNFDAGVICEMVIGKVLGLGRNEL